MNINLSAESQEVVLVSGRRCPQGLYFQFHGRVKPLRSAVTWKYDVSSEQKGNVSLRG